MCLSNKGGRPPKSKCECERPIWPQSGRVKTCRRCFELECRYYAFSPTADDRQQESQVMEPCPVHLPQEYAQVYAKLY